MKYELNMIWNEYEGQIFKTGDCSPLNRSVSQKFFVWGKDGEWEKSGERIGNTLEDFEKLVQWRYDIIERTKLGVKPKMTIDDIEILVKWEENKEIKEILTELMDVICEWWYDFPEHDTEEERDYLVYWEDRIADTVYNCEESLLEIDGSHRYFKFDTDYLQVVMKFDDEE
jgi:hypothetical protein